MILVTLFAICVVPIIAENEEFSKRKVWSQLNPKEKQDIVALHNKERQAIGGSNVMAVTWDDDLASLAQEWTDSCNNRHGHMKLPDGRAVGQNRAWSGVSVLDLAQGWVDEKSIYNVRSGRCNQHWKKCGHYAQMIWHNTVKVGCGITECPGMGLNLVCDYYPGGNVVDGSGGIQPPASFVGAPCSKCNIDPGTTCDNGICKPCNPSRDRNCTPYSKAACRNTNTDPNVDCEYMKTKCDHPDYKSFLEGACAKTCGHCRS